MSKNWSRIYNQTNYKRNSQSALIVNKSKKGKWFYKKTVLELFKVYNKKQLNFKQITSLNDFMKFLEITIKLKHGQSIMDYGSGNGFMLLYLSKKFNLKNVISAEVNKNSIEQQKIFLKDCKFIVLKPEKIPTELNSMKVDWVISNAVLHCLPSYSYAKKLILYLLSISKKGVFISNIFNDSYQVTFQAHQMTRQNLKLKKYRLKYKKTEQLHFKKSFFLFLKKKRIKYSFFDMPNTFYDSQFGRYAIKIYKK